MWTKRCLRTKYQWLKEGIISLWSFRERHSMEIRKQSIIVTLFYTCSRGRSLLFSSDCLCPKVYFKVWYLDALCLVCACTPFLKRSVWNSSAPQLMIDLVISMLHFSIHNIIEKFSIICILHHDKDSILWLYNFVKLSNRRMPHQFQDVQLSWNSLHISYVFYFTFL